MSPSPLGQEEPSNRLHSNTELTVWERIALLRANGEVTFLKENETAQPDKALLSGFFFVMNSGWKFPLGDTDTYCFPLGWEGIRPADTRCQA